MRVTITIKFSSIWNISKLWHEHISYHITPNLNRQNSKIAWLFNDWQKKIFNSKSSDPFFLMTHCKRTLWCCLSSLHVFIVMRIYEQVWFVFLFVEEAHVPKFHLQLLSTSSSSSWMMKIKISECFLVLLVVHQ